MFGNDIKVVDKTCKLSVISLKIRDGILCGSLQSVHSTRKSSDSCLKLRDLCCVSLNLYIVLVGLFLSQIVLTLEFVLNSCEAVLDGVALSLASLLSRLEAVDLVLKSLHLGLKELLQSSILILQFTSEIGNCILVCILTGNKRTHGDKEQCHHEETIDKFLFHCT